MIFTPSIASKIEQSSISTLDGDILYVGGSGEGNYSRIQDAIDNASNGDTVFVYDDSSPYYEYNITITKSINLFGEDKNTTIIEGEEKYDLITIVHDGVIISGFSIKNGRFGILLHNVGNVEIHQVNIYNNCFDGVLRYLKKNISRIYCKYVFTKTGLFQKY